MGRHDWYRNTSWNEEIEAAFNAKLSRSRGDFHKVQYIRIQGLSLIRTDDTLAQSVGIRLLNQVIKDFVAFPDEVNMAKEALGDHYAESKNWQASNSYFQDILAGGNKQGSGLVDFKYIENTMQQNDIAAMEAIYKTIPAIDVNDISLNSSRYYALKMLAFLCDRIAKKDDAKLYAKEALLVASDRRPQFSKHPDIGIPDPSEADIDALNQILNA